MQEEKKVLTARRDSNQDYRRNWEVEPEKTKRKRKNDIFQVFRGNAIAKHKTNRFPASNRG
jgi:hypothetical protein